MVVLEICKREWYLCGYTQDLNLRERERERENDNENENGKNKAYSRIIKDSVEFILPNENA